MVREIAVGRASGPCLMFDIALRSQNACYNKITFVYYFWIFMAPVVKTLALLVEKNDSITCFRDRVGQVGSPLSM